MREIKFRAWDKRYNLMHRVRGFEMYNIDAQALYSLNIEHGDMLVQVLDNFDDYILMQYTGLLDKNGKEIFEGDVVMIEHWKSTDVFDYSRPFIVEWMDGQIDFRQGQYHNFIGSLVGAKKFEVIGNIYQNPELITS